MGMHPLAGGFAGLALLLTSAAAQVPSGGVVTRIEAIDNLPGAAFSGAGKGREYLRVHVAGIPGPCLRPPGEFKLVHSGAKEAKAISVSFKTAGGTKTCDAFEVIFSPLARGTRPVAVRVKDVTLAAATVAVRTELRPAFAAGRVNITVTPKEGGMMEATLKNPGSEPLELFLIDQFALELMPPLYALILKTPEPKDITLPPGGDVTLLFGTVGPQRDITSTTALVPRPEK